VGQDPTHADLRAIDEGFYRLNRTIRGWREEKDGDFRETLQLAHVVINNAGVEAPLFRGGESVPVDFSNRLDYVAKCEEHRLNEFRSQALAIRAGLSTIVPISLLSLWSWEEFELQVCGKAGFDIALLKSHTAWKSYGDNKTFQGWL
jgi:hypothetical protein